MARSAIYATICLLLIAPTIAIAESDDSRFDAIENFESFESEAESNVNASGEDESVDSPAPDEEAQVNVNASMDATNAVGDDAPQAGNDITDALEDLEGGVDIEQNIGEVDVWGIEEKMSDVRGSIQVTIEHAKSRSGFVEFLIGPDFKEINKAKTLLERVDQEIIDLTEHPSATKSQTEIDERIEGLVQFRDTASAEIEKLEDQFSLFGWLVQLFS